MGRMNGTRLHRFHALRGVFFCPTQGHFGVAPHPTPTPTPLCKRAAATRTSAGSIHRNPVHVTTVLAHDDPMPREVDVHHTALGQAGDEGVHCPQRVRLVQVRVQGDDMEATRLQHLFHAGHIIDALRQWRAWVRVVADKERPVGDHEGGCGFTSGLPW